jgi:hypothetical protein
MYTPTVLRSLSVHSGPVDWHGRGGPPGGYPAAAASGTGPLCKRIFLQTGGVS